MVWGRVDEFLKMIFEVSVWMKQLQVFPEMLQHFKVLTSPRVTEKCRKTVELGHNTILLCPFLISNICSINWTGIIVIVPIF